jgi:hypothetical protein
LKGILPRVRLADETELFPQSSRETKANLGTTAARQEE